MFKNLFKSSLMILFLMIGLSGKSFAQELKFFTIGTGGTAYTYYPVGGMIANRKTFSSYFEVFLDTPFQQLCERDKNNLYAKKPPYVSKKVVGIELPFNKPKSPDLILKNKDGVDPEKLARLIIDKAGF